MTSHDSSPNNQKDHRREDRGTVLALASPEEELVAVLGRAKGMTSFRAEPSRGRLSTAMAPLVDDMLAKAELEPAHLGGVAVVTGPGAFTGLRLTHSYACGLALAAGVPLAGLPYLPLLAAQLMCEGVSRIAVATYARTGLVYLQFFEGEDERGPKPSGELATLSHADAAAAIRQEAGRAPVALLGSGMRQIPEELLTGAQVMLADEAYDRLDPMTLLDAALRADYSAQSCPEIIYARGSDAEDSLAHIASKQGLDADEAARELEKLLHKPIKL